jgi:hypothetical protein
LLLTGCGARSRHTLLPHAATNQHSVGNYCDEYKYIKNHGCVTRRRVQGGDAPAVCASSCVERTRAALGGVSLTLYYAPTASVLEATTSSGPPQWQVRNGESPVFLVCNSGLPAPQCVVVDAQDDPHGSTMTSYSISGKALQPASSIWSASSEPSVSDLNGDGYLDATTLEQSGERPSGQAGQVYWQTYLFNGHALVSSGCGAKRTMSDLGPRPTKPEAGRCPH